MNESVPQFRVGGVYRQQNGVIVRLTEFRPGVGLVELHGPDTPTQERNSGGGRYFSDGRYPGARANAEYECHLIPGELHQVNGEWVPVQATIGPFPSGATLTTSGDKIVGREEPTHTEAEVRQAIESIVNAGMKRRDTEAMERTKAGKDYERICGAINHAPFDNFKGFEVSRRTTCQPQAAGFASPDLQATSPLCGSADLLLLKTA